MGKTALLQAMAMKAAKQKHIQAFGNLYHEQSDFFSQIYPVIAQVKLKQRLNPGDAGDWLKAGLIGFTTAVGVMVGGTVAALLSGATALAGLEADIRKSHAASGQNNRNLARIFLDTLSERSGKMTGSQRIIIFLDPEKLTPRDMIPLLKQMVDQLPSRVRFVIAQRNTDCLVRTFKQGELRHVCRPPLRLEMLQANENLEFIHAHDPKNKLSTDIRSGVSSKYNGWPLLLSLAVEDLLKLKRDITQTDVDGLPSDIDGFWEKRYDCIENENALKLLHIVSLLPHPYPAEKLAKFCRFTHPAMAAVLNNTELKDILMDVDFKDPLYPEMLKDCPYPKHLTAKDYVKERLGRYEELKRQLSTDIIKQYQALIGDDLERPDIDPDALVNLMPMLLENNQLEDFLLESNRLIQIMMRYGLLDNCLKNLQITLQIYEKAGDKEGMVSLYGNMGIIYQTRGDLEQSLEVYQKSLQISRELGSKEDMASLYVNIGIVYQTRGDFEQALEMYQKSLQISRELGGKERMRSLYGNIGNVYQARGNLEQALGMYQKSLHISKELGSKEGMASLYGNMGIVYKNRGDLKQALEMYQKSLQISKELGHKEGMAIQYGNIGIIYQTRGDLEQALEMYQRSLQISRELGSKEGMAIQYGNMGALYKNQGDLEKAQRLWEKSLELFSEIGAAHKIERVKSWLRELSQKEKND
ncbi:MAG: tetratricopeptide repeat protein [Desulfobacter sp.]